MEKPMRARKRKLETDKVDLKPLFKELGGQGVHREVESEGHEEKYRAVIDGGYPEDEPVGQKVERGRACTMEAKAFLIRSTKPRCLRTARYGRTTRDLRRTGEVRGWHRDKRAYKRKRRGERS
jgi:hypothetical protein